MWDSKADAKRWDLKGHIEDREGEIFYIQGHPIALQGFVKHLKATGNIESVDETQNKKVSKIYTDLTGGTKPCACGDW